MQIALGHVWRVGIVPAPQQGLRDGKYRFGKAVLKTSVRITASKGVV
jgi:hypothetical protein